MIARACFLILLSVFSLTAAEDVAKLEVIVEQLADDDFKVRQQASDELLRRVEADPEFAKQLKPFADHEDPEVRFRIAELTKNLPVILPWMDPESEGDMKSLIGSRNTMKLTVKNRSKIEIQTYWIDWNGTRQPRRNVKPGDEIVIAKTYEDHPWLVADTKGKALGLYVPKGEKDVQIIYTGEERAK